MRKYLFGFNQHRAVEKGLALEHLAILKYMTDFWHSGTVKRTIISGKEYVWIHTGKIVDDMPILGIQADQVKRLIRTLEKAGIIKKKIVRSEGNRPYYTIDPAAYDHLTGQEPVQEELIQETPTGKNVRRVQTKMSEGSRQKCPDDSKELIDSMKHIEEYYFEAWETTFKAKYPTASYKWGANRKLMKKHLQELTETQIVAGLINYFTSEWARNKMRCDMTYFLNNFHKWLPVAGQPVGEKGRDYEQQL